MPELMSKIVAIIDHSECRSLKHAFMPSSPVSVSEFPETVSASALLGEDEQDYSLFFFEDLVHEESKSRDISPNLSTMQ